MIVKIALCGLKSSSAAFRTMLANDVHDLGYCPSKADPGACLKPATKPNGLRYHAMLLVCSDDMLSTSHEPFKAIDGVKSVLKLKGNKATVPETCLRGGMSEAENSNGIK